MLTIVLRRRLHSGTTRADAGKPHPHDTVLGSTVNTVAYEIGQDLVRGQKGVNVDEEQQ